MELRQDGENENRFELSFSSEAPYMRWSGMPEILVHTKKAVNFTRLRTAGALLFDHGCDSRIGRMPVGLIKSVTLDEEAHKGRAVIEFDPDDEDALKIRSKLQKKMLNGISVGYRVTEWQVLREGEKSADGRFAGPCYLATKWEPLEISVVATPADPTVGVGRSISNEEDNNMPEIETVTRTGEGAGTPPAAPAADNQAAVDAAVENERARAAAITTRCRHFGVSPDDYIARGLTVEQVNEDLLSTMEQRRQPLTGSSVGVVRDEGDKFRAAAADSILLRAGREVEKPADGARDLRSLTLRDIARSTLRIEGVEGWERMSNDQLFRAIVSPGSAFSSIMDDCVHKTMSNAYKTADTTFQLWTSKGTHADFRPKKIYEISEAGELDEVRENGEFKFGSVSDDSVTSVLATFGKKFGFTRKALIDDDLDVLTKIPAAYVRAAKRGVNKAVYNLLIKNPVMADGKNLFSADHGNIVFSCIIAHNLTSFPIYSEIQLIPKIKYNNFDILFSHAELFKYLIDHRIRNTLSGQFIQSCNGTLQRDRHRVPRHAHKQSVFRFLQRRERLLYVRALALRIENAVVRVQLSGFQCARGRVLQRRQSLAGKRRDRHDFFEMLIELRTVDLRREVGFIDDRHGRCIAYGIHQRAGVIVQLFARIKHR